MLDMNSGSPAQQLQRFSEYLDALEKMTATPGWKMFTEYMQGEQRLAMSTFDRKATTGEDALRMVTMHRTLEMMLQWADVQKKWLRTSIDSLAVGHRIK